MGTGGFKFLSPMVWWQYYALIFRLHSCVILSFARMGSDCSLISRFQGFICSDVVMFSSSCDVQV